MIIIHIIPNHPQSLPAWSVPNPANPRRDGGRPGEAVKPLVKPKMKPSEEKSRQQQWGKIDGESTNNSGKLNFELRIR